MSGTLEYVGSSPGTINSDRYETQTPRAIPASTTPPPVLEDLFDAGDDSSRERAWRGFRETYEPAILHTLRQLGLGPRARENRLAFVLGCLSSERFRCLREYSSDPRSGFDTWLCVMVHRLGRGPGKAGDTEARPLGDLLAEHLGTTDRETLEARLHALPPRDRLLLKLRFELGLPVRRISNLLGFPTRRHVSRRCQALCRGLSGPAAKP